MKVWVLDIEGYDAHGGNARVFSTKEAAKAAVPHVTNWKPNRDDDGEYQDCGMADGYVVYSRTLDTP